MSPRQSLSTSSQRGGVSVVSKSQVQGYREGALARVDHVNLVDLNGAGP